MPELNNAQITGTKNYRVLHSIEQVDANIWKGKALPEALPDSRIRQAMAIACERDWIFFHRDYDFERNDWDRLYHEHEITDETIFGVKVILIPVEKLLFSYQPPTEGIIIPQAGSVLPGRSHQ